MNYYNYQTYNNFDYSEFVENNMRKSSNIGTNNSLYSPYEGFIRGNMFKNLYDPYLSAEPYEIRPMNEQAETLTEIDSLCFALIDLGLYLDVYPNDRDIINLYNNYLSRKTELTNNYEKKYGPLTLNSSALNTYPWAWESK